MFASWEVHWANQAAVSAQVHQALYMISQSCTAQVSSVSKGGGFSGWGESGRWWREGSPMGAQGGGRSWDPTILLLNFQSFKSYKKQQKNQDSPRKASNHEITQNRLVSIYLVFPKKVHSVSLTVLCL